MTPNNIPPLRRETELLLQCARSYIDPIHGNDLRNLAGEGIDWQYVIRTALEHGVMPMLYLGLHSFCSEAVPTVTMHQLRELFYANAQRNLFLSSELLKLLRLLDTHGISAIPFKGPVLSVSAYKNLSLRQCRDLDILVRKKDILTAKDLLISEGYRPWRAMTQAQETSHLRSHHALVFLPKSEMYSVDLHWAIAPPHHSFPLDAEALWERLELRSFAGKQIPALPPQDLILVLCIHGSKHGWERLIWICDIAELIRSRPEIDWKPTLEEAHKVGSFRRVLLALLLVRDLLGVNLPHQVLEAADSYPGVKRLSRFVTRQLFSDEKVYMLSRFRRTVLVLRSNERIQDQFIYFLHQLKVAMVPNSKDHDVVSLPLALSFLYYMIRPIRLVITYAFIPLVRPNEGRNGGNPERGTGYFFGCSMSWKSRAKRL